jgi:hypothetical protein
MKFYFTQTKDGSGEVSTLGPFDSAEDAEPQRAALAADFPADAIGAAFEEADDYLETLPVAIMIMTTSEGDVEVYSDGTQKPVA